MDGDKKKAMVVDDSRAMRKILARSLTNMGFEVSEAGNGQEALALLQTDITPLVMLIDWNMPVMCGFDLVKAIRTDNRFAETTLVMVTTETEIEHMSQALSAGANEYVMKPFTPDVIEEKFRSLNLIQ